MIRHLFCLAGLLCVAVANAGTPWTLTTADFHAQPVTLKSIDSVGVHVTIGSGEEKAVPFDQFLDLSRSVATAQPGGKFVLHLIGDDHIGGEPVAIKGNDLVWSNPILGEIAIPMKTLVAMTRAGANPPDARRREDVITLANGDTLRGIISDFTDAKVTVQSDTGNNQAPIASVSQISFAITAGKIEPAHGFRVRFDDGSILVAESIKTADDKAELSFRKGSTQTIDLGRVAFIEQLNGPVSWLSSRTPSENVYIPFIGLPQTGAARMDHNWTGHDPIRFGTQQFVHGIGVHSYSRLSWNLDGTFEAFRTRYAIDTKDSNTRADVTVRILLDDKPVYEQKHVRAGTLSPVIIEELKKAAKLTLEVDYGDNMDTQDRMNWIEPALLKHKPSDNPPAEQ